MKKQRSSGLLTGLSWVMSANVISLGATALLTLVLPRVISPMEFGFWQLYQLFSLYLGYLTFGYSDGVNLRLAGRRIRNVSRRQVSSGLFYLSVLDAVLFFALVTLFAIISPGDAGVLFGWAAVGALFYIPRTVMSVVFQSTGLAKAYSITIVVERLTLVVGVLVLLAVGETSTTTLVVADVASKVLGLVVAIWLGRSTFVAWPSARRSVIRVFMYDCRDGAYVLFANIAAMLIQGGVRGIIVQAWDVVVFGQVSLAFQFASLFMVAVNSVAISVLPNLKRIDRSTYVSAYIKMRRRMVTPLVLCLALCFPLTNLLDWWLPEYDVAVFYMALLFPLFVYESLNRGLTAVFMKAMRIERSLLMVNFVALAVAMVSAAVGAYVLQNLNVTVLSIVAALAVRALLSEIVVARTLRFSVTKDWLLESGIVLLFLLTFLTGRPWWLIVVFLFSVITYAVAQFIVDSKARNAHSQIEVKD